ncbi:hypothetical protein FACS1894167_11170 [Synergistales bacterium]|nr:hypothetical protein FACS1894167_11170 [Synergistales bacterium]
MFDKVKSAFGYVCELVDAIGDSKLIELKRFLAARIANPESYVVLLGETSSGKSTLLNGLMGNNILYTSVKPATGTIVELCLSESSETAYFVINKNATMEKLSREQFSKLSKSPDSNIARLRLCTQSDLHGLGSLRLFDTPGYGSLVAEHEEVLSDFLPQSDIVIYTVMYKVGIQESDYSFLDYAQELIGNALAERETDFILVINRTPEGVSSGDRRIKEIVGYVADILHHEPKTFIVNTVLTEENEYPLPKSESLWRYVQSTVSSSKRVNRLAQCLFEYVEGLLDSCESFVLERAIPLKLAEEERNIMKKELKKLKAVQIEIKDELIEPTFERLAKLMPSAFSRVRETAYGEICEKIDSDSKLRTEEVTAFINSHLMPFALKNGVDEIKFTIDSELNELDRKIQDKLNTAYADIKSQVELHFNTEAAKLVDGALKKMVGRAAEQSLLNYFQQFAGRGGTGIANGAKHLLKKIGDLFGHTFTRETHNNVAKFLSKIGATSAKAVGVAVVVLLEVIFQVKDIMTWQGKLKKAVDTSLGTWEEEMLQVTLDELDKLKEENIRLVDEQIDELVAVFSAPVDISSGDIEKLQILLDSTKQKMEALKHG